MKRSGASARRSLRSTRRVKASESASPVATNSAMSPARATPVVTRKRRIAGAVERMVKCRRRSTRTIALPSGSATDATSAATASGCADGDADRRGETMSRCTSIPNA